MKKILLGFGLILLIILLLGGYVLYQYGPNFNLYLFPPSVEKYVSLALQRMDQGYYGGSQEWKEKRQEIVEKASSYKSYDETLDDLNEASKVAGGKHSFIIKESEVGETSQSNQSPVIHKDGDILYLKLTPILLADEAFSEEYVNTLDSALAKKDYKGVIIDLTGNTGGDMHPMLSGVRRLLPEGTLFSFKDVTGGMTPVTLEDGIVNGTTFNFTNSYEHVEVPVAVITDEMTAISGEIVALSLQSLSKHQRFGKDTAGYTSANSQFNLYDGSILQLTTASLIDREGEEYFNVSLTPDVQTEASYEEAIGWLREQE